MKRIFLLLLIILFLMPALWGCAGILNSSTYLPSAKTALDIPWKSFEEVKADYDAIVPGVTTVEDLKKEGFDPYTNPSIKILNFPDIVDRYLKNPSIKKEDLDKGIQRALEAKSRCAGYLIEAYAAQEKSTSNFWLYTLKFKQKVRKTGWQFTGLVLIVDNVVVYKDPVAGQPKIDTEKTKIKPLGPLQDLGDGWMLFF